MDKSPRRHPSSPYSSNGFDDFDFIEYDDIDMEADSYMPEMRSNSVAQNVVPAVIKALTKVTTAEGLLVTNIAKTVLTSTASGGCLGGIPGLAVGAISGVLVAGGVIAISALKKRWTENTLNSLPPQHQKQLVMQLGRAVKNCGIKDLAKEILHRNEVKDMALRVLSKFLEEKYGVKLTRI